MSTSDDLPGDGPREPLLNENVLVISDLHLGEDLKAQSYQGHLRRLVRLEHQLCEFLDHYTAHTVQGRPWRLVVNGDMVDFMHVCLRPGLDVPGWTAAGGDEERWGLGTSPEAVTLKLERVVARHEPLFSRLARFVAAGHRLDIVLGNHDIDFHWEQVQEAFRGHLARLAGAGAVPGGPDEGLRERIAFHPWFYSVPGLLWIEHGHQYDEYSAFDHPLHPVLPRERELALGLGGCGIRYFINKVPDMDQHAQEHWTFQDYLRWAAAKGARHLAYVFYCYTVFCRRVWRLRRAMRSSAARALRVVHLDRLRDLARRYRIEEETLLALDGLRCEPVHHRAGALLQTLYLDRFALAAGAALAALVSLAALSGAALGASLVGTIAGVALANGALSRRRRFGTAGKLRLAAARVRERVRARFVVFGHSHAPEAHALAEDAWYFNTGTWVDHVQIVFTHLRILGDGDAPRAELCRWLDGRSVTLAAPGGR